MKNDRPNPDEQSRKPLAALTDDEKMERLLHAAEHPGDYTDEELDALLRDPQCRAYWNVMVEAEEGFRMKAQADRTPAEQPAENPVLIPSRAASRGGGTWHLSRVAALFIGILMLGGITFAAIHLVRSFRDADRTEQTAPVAQARRTAKKTKTPAAPVAKEKAPEASLYTFTNVPLSDILTEMGKYYALKIDIRNAQARSLRLFYKWNKGLTADEVVSDLNHFDQVNLTITDHTIIAE